MDKKIARWEIAGIFLIVCIGSLLHFCFEWTGFLRPIAVIAAVNESTWEHLKLAFWPGLFFGVIEYFTWGRKLNNFFPAKFFGLLVMPVIIALLFYGYTAIWNDFLAADIIIFIIAVAAGQLLSLNILRKDRLKTVPLRVIGIAGLVLLILAFSTLTYYPRKNFLFVDPVSGSYGIPDAHSTLSRD